MIGHDMTSPFVRYTLLRVLAFAICLFVLALIPPLRANVLLLVLIAATVSMFVSLFLLNGPRDELSARIADRVETRAEAKHAADGTGTHPAGRRARHVGRAEAEEDAEIGADGESFR